MKTTPSTDRIEAKFLEMMSDMPYSKIAMKSLADELQMTRQNIYRHYSSKEQIFSSIIEDKLEELFPLIENMAPSINDETWDTLVTLGVQLIYDNKHIMTATFNSGEDELLLRLMRSFMTRCLGHVARTHNIRIRNETYFKMLVGFLTGSGFYMFKTWAQDGADVPPESISKIHKSISATNIIDLLRECE
jgi:AcrR family transcriptional regulator